jgi:hypothetical protein
LLLLSDPIVARVKSQNTIGWSIDGTPSTGSDVTRTPPLAPPTQVASGAATSDSQIQISWNAITDPTTGLDSVIKYSVFWDNGSNGVNWLNLVTETVGGFTFTYTFSNGVSPGLIYQFKYRASN